MIGGLTLDQPGLTLGKVLDPRVDRTRVSGMVIGMATKRITTTVRKLTPAAIAAYVRDHCEFRAASMSGVCEAVPYLGRLEGSEWEDRYREDVPRIDYTILSYATPIAWHTEGGWIVVTATVSSPRHQAITAQLYPRAEQT